MTTHSGSQAVWSRWQPVYCQIRKELREGTLGDPQLIQATFCVQSAHVERIKNVAMGGGGLLDIGIYVVQFATLVFPEMPESITAVGRMNGGEYNSLK